LVPLWALIAVLAVTTLPGVGEGQGDAIDSSLLPRESAAVRAELLSKERFPVPLVARTHVVHDNRAGLPLTAAQDAAALARDVQDGRFPELDGLAAVVPIPNTVFEPGLRTTTVLYGSRCGRPFTATPKRPARPVRRCERGWRGSPSSSRWRRRSAACCCSGWPRGVSCVTTSPTRSSSRYPRTRPRNAATTSRRPASPPTGSSRPPSQSSARTALRASPPGWRSSACCWPASPA
jgi:hypothetical protein